MNCYLHVGLPRTGTTWLQEQVFERLPNVKYNQHHLKICLIWHRNMRHIEKDVGVSPLLARELFIYEALYQNKEPVILSLEGLSVNWFTETHVDVAGVIHEIYPDFKILIALRDFDDWLQSMYSWSIENLAFMSFEEYTHNKNRTSVEDVWSKGFDAEKCDFESKVNRYKELFNDVKVVHYEDLKANPQNYANDICDWLEVEHVKVDPKPIHQRIDTKKAWDIYNEHGKSSAINYVLKITEGISIDSLIK